MDIKEFMKEWMDEESERTRSVLKIHLSHNDLDGVGCHYVDHSFRVNSIKICYGNPGNLGPAIDHVLKEIQLCSKAYFKATILVLITDLGPKQKELDKLLNSNSKISICVVDHHQTCPDYENNPRVAYLKNTKFCATKLLYDLEFRNSNKEYSGNTEEIVRMINRYDMGRWNSWTNPGLLDILKNNRPKYSETISIYDIDAIRRWGDFLKSMYEYIDPAIKLNFAKDYVFRLDDLKKQISAPNEITMYKLETAFISIVFYDKVCARLNSMKNFIVKNMIEMYDEIIRYNKEKKFFRLPGSSEAGVFVPGDCKSFFIVARELMEQHPEIPYVCSVYWKNKTLSACTTRDDINLGELFSPYGGGGHPKAAGVSAESIGLILDENNKNDVPAWADKE